MLTAIYKKKSLTFYQIPSIAPERKITEAYSGGISANTISNSAYATWSTTNNFNDQLNRYLVYNQRTQAELFARTKEYMDSVYANNPNPSSSALRDKNTWTSVKRFVTREELMKLQIGDKTDLPLSDQEIETIKKQLVDKDLTSCTDKEIQNIIDNIVGSNDREYMDALIDFKNNGQPSDLFQQSKLEALREELEKIDLDKITSKEYKYLKEKYFERREYHHKESISSDPNKQSDADNIDVLNTSEHDKRHTHDEKVNYKEPVKETPNNRNQDLKDANKKRVFKNELRGLGMAVAIGAGIGFTISFITTLAQTGVSPDSLKNAAASGVKSGIESGILSGVSYVMARTLGEVATKALTEAIENIGISVTENMAKMVNMGVVGSLTIIAFSVYQFVKLKINGVATRDALIQTGRQALFSLSLLAVSIAAQGIWGGPAGIIVSISAGILVIAYSTATSIHQRHFSEKVRVYTIERCYPCLAA